MGSCLAKLQSSPARGGESAGQLLWAMLPPALPYAALPEPSPKSLRTVADIRSNGGTATSVQADVTDYDSVVHAFDARQSTNSVVSTSSSSMRAAIWTDSRDVESGSTGAVDRYGPVKPHRLLPHSEGGDTAPQGPRRREDHSDRLRSGASRKTGHVGIRVGEGRTFHARPRTRPGACGSTISAPTS